MLRNFYCGQKLQFDAAGKLVAGGQPGPWTTCSDIRIQKFHVGSGKIKITGQRVYLFYDAGTKQYRDVMEIEPPQYKQTKTYEAMLDNQKVSIEMPVQQGDDATVTAAMNAVFYASMDELRQDVPEFWRVAMAAPPLPHPEPANAVFHTGHGVGRPTAVYTPDPDYSEEARQAKYQGVVVLTIVIGPDGRVHNASIKRPLGMGLDEKSIEKVLTWKFKPGMRDGQPVAVEVSVEVSFNLY